MYLFVTRWTMDTLFLIRSMCKEICFKEIGIRICNLFLIRFSYEFYASIKIKIMYILSVTYPVLQINKN